MTYSTELKDYKQSPKELIGKTVLVEYSSTYGGTKKSISEIVSVTKTSFKIKDAKQSLYSLDNGQQRGLSGRIDMATISRCTLISEERAEELKEVWRLNNRKRELVLMIQEKVDEKDIIKQLEVDTLETIIKLLKIDK